MDQNLTLLLFLSEGNVWGVIVSVQRFISSFNAKEIRFPASVFGVLAMEVCQGDKTIILFLIRQKAVWSKLVAV